MRRKTQKPATEDLGVLMLVRDRDEQKRIADGMQALYLAECETTKQLRAEVEKLLSEATRLKLTISELRAGERA